MIVKIIFSDNSVMAVQCHNSSIAKSLKKVRDDDEANEILARFQGEYEIGDDDDASRAGTSVDLRRKKISSQKERSKAYGEKYR